MDPIQLANRLDDEFRTSCAVLDQDQPWFGHFAVRVDGRVREYRVGRFRVTGQRILPATHPLATAFYGLEPGEEFELDWEGLEQFSGTVEHQARLTTAPRRIQSLSYSDVEREAVVVRTDQGFELRVDTSRGLDAQTGLPDILALLTRDQYRLIAHHQGQPVIIQGRAGSGKTSVALYRVAWLANPVAGTVPAVDPSRVLIVMFNKALSMFVREALPGLDLERAVLDTFHGWALDRVHRAYKGNLEIDTPDLPGRKQAAALKKTLGVLHAVEAYVRAQRKRVAAWLRAKLAPYKADAWTERFEASEAAVVRALVDLRVAAREARDASTGFERQRLEQVVLVFERAVDRVRQYKEELLAILTDRALLVEHLPEAVAADIDALIDYQKTLQGRDGSARRPGPFVAFEDLAILLRLIQLKNGGLPNVRDTDPVDVYDHLVIDEAQDFGAVELTVLLSAVKSRTGVTIAGDINQKIKPEADFMGWDALAAELGVEGAKVSRLEVPHRATLPIMRVADTIVGDETLRGRSGPTPTLTLTDSPEAQLERTEELIRTVLRDHPGAHVCVVARHRSATASVQQELDARLAADGISVRLGHNDQFVFQPGVTVTNLLQVKGLEFDAVVALDATEQEYPDTQQGQRNLYMLLTRAKDRLDLVCPGTLTPWLARARDEAYLEVVERFAVAPVQFSPEEAGPL